MEQTLDARLAAFRKDEERKMKLRERINQERRFLIPIFVFVALLFPNFGRVAVVGNSMNPTFETGEKLVMLKSYRIFAPLKVGDVVVIQKRNGQYKGEDLIKRVVYIQNEQGNAAWPEKVTLGNETLEPKRLFPAYTLGFRKVPKHHVLVVGDNVWNSTDSRDPEVGPIADTEIIGKVLYR